ncbi:MAG: ATP-binding protein [Thiolinea sp.]
MSQKRKKLPIGIQTFREIREENHYYVDKTQLALDLVEGGKHYFLSRPRRFGKSLFLDTLKALFEGNQTLFNGLAAEKQWDWSVSYPVLRFSFSGNSYNQMGQLTLDLTEQLADLAETYQYQPRNQTCPGRLRELIRHLEQQTGQSVVILVDEYDKPILDALKSPEVAKANRDFLRGFYGIIKDYDAHIKFSFFTGVSKFSKVSIFSGLNNLNDITLDPRYATICGYTDLDIDTVFATELDDLDRDEIRKWYNGYHWRGEGIYNPFDILQLFDKRQFDNYWFETGTPTFLVNLLFERQIATLKLNNLFSSSAMLSSFDVDVIETEALLFQTGYLTIKQEENLGGQRFYQLGYPNREVYQSLNEQLLSSLVKDKSEQAIQSGQLYRLLMVNDFNGLKKLFHGFFASIPHHWYTNSKIQNYEGYYASVFYSYFASLGLDITVEDATNLGRIDMTLKFNEQVYIFEFKVVELVPEGNALQQIKRKGYADKYRELGRPIHLIGVEFSKDNRNIAGFETEVA